MSTTRDDDPQLRALSALRLSWVTRPQDVWGSYDEHVVGLHGRATTGVGDSILDAKEATEGNPPGLVIEGEAGTGKSHLLGWTRGEVQRDGGYFFLISLSQGETFWESVLESVLDGLWRKRPDTGVTQLQFLLTRLGEQARVSRSIRAAIEGRAVTKLRLDKFVQELTAATRIRPEVQETARAVVLYASNDPVTQDIAKGYFLSTDEVDPGTRALWGINSARSAQRIVEDLSLLLSFTGHSVIAVDQIDTLFARASSSPATVLNSAEDANRDHVVTQVGDGLMGLQERTHRSLVVVACLQNSWTLIRARAGAAVTDRFRRPLDLGGIPNVALARALIEKKLSRRYETIGFVPPHPTWPVAPQALAGAVRLTPRDLMRRIDEHAEACLDAGTVTELASFTQTPVIVPPPVAPPDLGPDLGDLDRRFAALRSQAQVSSALDPKEEDLIMPALLLAGLNAWIAERGIAGQEFKADPPPSSKPPLHARLRQVLDEGTETENHVAFRAIAHTAPQAALPRLRSATNEVGMRAGDPSRRLIILRDAEWSGGVKTQAEVKRFTEAGGVTLRVGLDDLRTFDALRVLMEKPDAALASWLAARRPASSTELFRTALPSTAEPAAAQPPSTLEPEKPEEAGEPDAPDPLAIDLGVVTGTGRPVRIALEALRKHTAVFAGSGSGKTVLIRRLVEECALRGVSSIVLDPNNDLARLGDAWPRPPAEWAGSDPARAAEYLAHTDVVVWTPRREGGRPLTFQPLPDFTSVLDDPDEFGLAVDVAVAGLAPRAKVDGTARKPQIQQAVLRETIRYFARSGSGSLEDLIELMEDLPSEVSSMSSASTIAAEMAQTLRAAMVNDPLFGGRGTPVDPALLLTPAPGKRARVSVISLVGLPSDQQRQGFVSQLQMALFSWFKRHPAGDRPLGGLLVMDEAQTIAPSGTMTLSTESTLVLASQARKYGLGLIFATQAPKGLHNRIPGNAATQFFGFLNSPSQIAAAQEIARAKGGSVSEISRLTAGEFYLAEEGSSMKRLRTPYSLSYHPRSPLTTDEVIARARGRSPDPPPEP
jgi:Helicase HerA, central domain